MRSLKKFRNIYLIGFLIFFIISCGNIQNKDKNIVGNNLINATLLNDVNSSTNLEYVKLGIDENATFAFAYKSMKITYKTKDEFNNDITASGVLVYPNVSKAFLDYYKTTYKKDYSISLIVNNHGTIFTNDEAPSNEINTIQSASHSLAVLMTARAGFAVIMPDYLGYGISNNSNHPYMIKDVSAKVSIDILRASSKYMIDNNILFNGQVYITGYSQGGYVAMAMAKEIEQNYSNDFKLKGVAPMAGPYDLKALANNKIDANKTMQYPAFLAYIANSYSNQYDDVKLLDLVNQSNASEFASLFNGDLSGTQIHIALGLSENYGYKTYKTNALFKDSMIGDYKASNDYPFKLRLEQNDVSNWKVKTKMNLIHCIEDEIIPYSISSNTYNNFVNNGSKANVTLSSIPTSYLGSTYPFIHANCASTAYGVAVKWFDAIRKGDIK